MPIEIRYSWEAVIDGTPKAVNGSQAPRRPRQRALGGVPSRSWEDKSLGGVKRDVTVEHGNVSKEVISDRFKRLYKRATRNLSP